MPEPQPSEREKNLRKWMKTKNLAQYSHWKKKVIENFANHCTKISWDHHMKIDQIIDDQMMIKSLTHRKLKAAIKHKKKE